MAKTAYIHSYTIASTTVQHSYPDAISEPCYASNMEHFVKIVNGLKLLTILTKCSILDV